MSYIITNANPFISIKLTDKGREQLSLGQLTFSSWAIGDSEINYEREEIVDANPNSLTLSGSSRIMRPFDKQPNIKSFISSSISSSPYQPINSGNLNVIKASVNNEADERGFFTSSGSTYTTISGSPISTYNTLVANSGFNGSSIITVGSTSGLTVGDVILIKFVNNSVVSGHTVFSNVKPLPSLWFKVKALSPTTITVDRNTPNYSSETTYQSELIAYPSGEIYDTIASGTTTAYWDSGTLSFSSFSDVSCGDVPVWNMNNVWSESLAGITGLTSTNLYEDYTKFGSYNYLGAKYPFFDYDNISDSATTASNASCNGGIGISYDDDVNKSISIIHFTNNSISTLYGEFIYIDATNNKILKLELPDLMYHRRNYSTGTGTQQGMTFIASGITQYIGTSDVEYIDLIEDPSLVDGQPLVIGKMFPQLKTIVISDDEIVAAISYKSNRNWTLPKLGANLTAPTGTGVLGVGEVIYLTYALENSISGLTTALPCQKYIKLLNDSSASKDVSFRVNGIDQLPYMRKKETGWDGLGFYADEFKLVYQVVSDSITRPDPSAWRVADFTSTAITTTSGQTINPLLLENQNLSGFTLTSIINSGSSMYSIIQALNMPANTTPNDLQFGDERFFYGNLTTFIGATIYKTIFDIRINSTMFNVTSNPTRSNDSSTNPPNLKISEVGIYDNNSNLVCIGKLNMPIPIINGNSIMLELSMDF